MDRTGSAQSCPPLRFGKQKYGFHGWPRTLRICACGRSFSPVPDDPHRKKGETQMTNHYVATVPVKFTDGEGQ